MKFPIPKIDYTLARLSGCTVFSVIDLIQAFHQVPLSKATRKYASFSTPSEHLQLTRLAMGLQSSPAVFQRFICRVLAPLIGVCCFPYLDDVIVFSKDFDSHIVDMEKVIRLLKSYGLHGKFTKTKLFRREVQYLGHVVSDEGIKPVKDRIRAIQDMVPPTTVSELKSFLGMCNWFQKFVPRLAEKAVLLTNLLKKGESDEGKLPNPLPQDVLDSFEAVKTALAQATTLSYPDFHRPFILSTDASHVAAGAVLTQPDESGAERPIAFYSSKFSKSELNYDVVNKEILAAVKAMKHFEEYLFGQQFILYTDNAAASAIKSKENQVHTDLHARWMAIIDSKMRPIYKYRPGEANIADAPSRLVRGRTAKVHAVEVSAPAQNDGEPAQAAATENTNVPDLTRKLFADAQDSDTELKAVKAVLNQRSAKKVKYWSSLLQHLYIANDNVLMIQDSKGNFDDRIVVPRAVREVVMKHYHDLNAHIGCNKVFRAVREFFFWPSLFKDIESYCESCTTCAVSNKSSVTYGKLQALPAVARFGERVHIDLTDFAVSSSVHHNHYILAIQDAATRFLVLVAIKDKQATTIAKTLHDNWLKWFGAPSVIVSDNGGEFRNAVIAELAQAWSFKQAFTSSYHPQSNSMVERSNLTYKTMIKACCTNHRRWDETLSQVQMIYNNSFHSAIGSSPYFALTGQNASFPQDIGLKLSQSIPDVSSQQEFNKLMNELAQKQREEGAKITERTQASSQKRINATRRTSKGVFEVGAKVWKRVFQPKAGVSTSLSPRFEGPYVITKVSKNKTAVWLKGNGINENYHYHVKDLKPFVAKWKPTRKPIKTANKPPDTSTSSPSTIVIIEESNSAPNTTTSTTTTASPTHPSSPVPSTHTPPPPHLPEQPPTVPIDLPPLEQPQVDTAPTQPTRTKRASALRATATIRRNPS